MSSIVQTSANALTHAASIAPGSAHAVVAAEVQPLSSALAADGPMKWAHEQLGTLVRTLDGGEQRSPIYGPSVDEFHRYLQVTPATDFHGEMAAAQLARDQASNGAQLVLRSADDGSVYAAPALTTGGVPLHVDGLLAPNATGTRVEFHSPELTMVVGKNSKIARPGADVRAAEEGHLLAPRGGLLPAAGLTASARSATPASPTGVTADELRALVPASKPAPNETVATRASSRPPLRIIGGDPASLQARFPAIAFFPEGNVVGSWNRGKKLGSREVFLGPIPGEDDVVRGTKLDAEIEGMLRARAGRGMHMIVPSHDATEFLVRPLIGDSAWMRFHGTIEMSVGSLTYVDGTGAETFGNTSRIWSSDDMSFKETLRKLDNVDAALADPARHLDEQVFGNDVLQDPEIHASLRTLETRLRAVDDSIARLGSPGASRWGGTRKLEKLNDTRAQLAAQIDSHRAELDQVRLELLSARQALTEQAQAHVAARQRLDDPHLAILGEKVIPGRPDKARFIDGVRSTRDIPTYDSHGEMVAEARRLAEQNNEVTYVGARFGDRHHIYQLDMPETMMRASRVMDADERVTTLASGKSWIDLATGEANFRPV